VKNLCSLPEGFVFEKTEKWQFFWDNESFGRLIFNIQPKVKRKKKKIGDSVRTKVRHEEVTVMWASMALGHTSSGSDETLFLMKKHVTLDGN